MKKWLKNFFSKNSKPVGEYFKIYKEINPDAYFIWKISLELYHSKGFKPDLKSFKNIKVDYIDNIGSKPEYKMFNIVLNRKGEFSKNKNKIFMILKILIENQKWMG